MSEQLPFLHKRFQNNIDTLQSDQRRPYMALFLIEDLTWIHLYSNLEDEMHIYGVAKEPSNFSNKYDKIFLKNRW